MLNTLQVVSRTCSPRLWSDDVCLVRLGKIISPSFLRHDGSVSGISFGMHDSARNVHIRTEPAPDACWDRSIQRTCSHRTHGPEHTFNLGLRICVPRAWNGYHLYRESGTPLPLQLPIHDHVQYITVHFYRAIRYGFHRCVNHLDCRSQIPLILIWACSGSAANSTFVSVGPPGNLIGCHNYIRLTPLPGFTALAILKLGTYGRTM